MFHIHRDFCHDRILSPSFSHSLRVFIVCIGQVYSRSRNALLLRFSTLHRLFNFQYLDNCVPLQVLTHTLQDLEFVFILPNRPLIAFCDRFNRLVRGVGDTVTLVSCDQLPPLATLTGLLPGYSTTTGYETISL